jgi:hypothetical protein
MGKKITNEDFIKRLYDVNKNIKTIDQYTKCMEKIRFQCLIDGTVFSATPNNVLRGHGCPTCGLKKCIKNSYDTKILQNKVTLIGNKYPKLINYLKNKEDAFKYGYTSRTKLDWVCPICNYEFKKSMSSNPEGSFVCPNCIKNDSYPNRFMFNILTQLGIDFIREYSPDWLKPKRFDFYFLLNNNEYIVEMDGGFHRYKNVKENDLEKDLLAINHNINVIRIDCDYVKLDNRFVYIQEAVKDSSLKNILNFSNVDFNEANAFALKNEVSHVCELWEKYKDLDKIQEETKLTLYTIKKYLNFGAENNMCSYNHEQCMQNRKEQRIKKGIHGRSVFVMCNETGEIFTNMKSASDKYKCNVSRYFYQNGTYAGILPDGTKLTWTKLDNPNKQKETQSI